MGIEHFYQKNRWSKFLVCIGSFIAILTGLSIIYWFYKLLLGLYLRWNCNFPCVWASGTVLVMFILVSIFVWFKGSYLIRLVVKKRKNVEQPIIEQSVSENNQDASEKGLREIKNYWGERTKAQEDIKKYLRETQTKKLIISAIGFGTLESILSDRLIVDNVVRLIKEPHSTFKMTIIFPKDATEWRTYRPDLLGDETTIQKNIEKGHTIIKKFIAEIKGRLSQNENKTISNYITLRHYTQRAFPRHFMLRGDETIFVGSYCYIEGSKAYLLQLREWRQETNNGLFNLFQNQAEHICKNTYSEEITCDDFLNVNDSLKLSNDE